MVEKDLAAKAIDEALKRGGDFAEIYAERRQSVSLSLEDSRLERSSTGLDAGASIRVIMGRNLSFVSTDSLEEESILQAARLAGEGLANGGARPQQLSLIGISSPHTIEIPPDSVPTPEKASLLRSADEAARATGTEIVQASISYGDDVSEVMVANSEGALATEERTRVRIIARVVGARNGIMQTGYESVGAHKGMEILGDKTAAAAGRAAGEKALAMLDSRPSPSGKMTVVMHRGFGGVLFHEACGHGLEADTVEKNTSVFGGRMGEQVAAGMVTLVDDGSIPGEWGSNAFDDEGTPTQRTVLIEEGRLAGLMYDGLRARNAGVKSTGNGRRQSFRHVPIPRMTNTFILDGAHTRDEIIAATELGFYAKTLSGGQVETASGDFVFGVSEGYLIEKGRITSPLRGATLIGNGLTALMNIDMIADDFEMNIGLCGKDGQSVPAGSGQSTLRIQNMTIGGTEV
ncbi:MAG: TldD/PmbA family protein [Thermoleophilia bacterium]|nr:TldD/PmbA family protein [Thermoleophilia bacterium]